jgi:hypothetical protein
MTSPCINGERHNISIKGDKGICLKCSWVLTPQQVENWRSNLHLTQTIVLGPLPGGRLVKGSVWVSADGKLSHAVRNGSLTKTQKWAATLARIYGDVCAYCEDPLTDDTRTLDHYIPVSLGGRNVLGNLRLCCRQCNARKKNIPGPIWDLMRYGKVCDGCVKRWTLRLQPKPCCADKLVNAYTI